MAGIGSALGSVVGGIAGQQAASGSYGQQESDQIRANQILQQIKGLPDDYSKAIALQQYKSAGVITPAMEDYITAGDSGLSKIKSNQQAVQAQQQALQALTQRSQQGLTATDRAALEQIRQQQQGDIQAKNAQILQQMQQRGQAGGGAALAAQLLAAQQGANTESQQGLQVGAQAQQAALQAASQMGQLGGQIEGQQFGEQSQIAQAQDAMQRFNVQNQIAAQQQNVQAQNQAQYANLANAQNIANMNTQAANQELYNQKQREMGQYQAGMNLGEVQAGGYSNLGNFEGQQAKRLAQGQQDLWSGIGGLAGAGASAAFGMPSFGGGTKSTGGGGSTGTQPGTETNQGFDLTSAGAGTYANYNKGGEVGYYKYGGQIPGQPTVPGDSIKNDKVHAMLSPGEIVVPRSLAESGIGKKLLKLIEAHNSVKDQITGEDN